MRPSGQAAIEAAKADGRWKPPTRRSHRRPSRRDFQAALDANPKAKELFETLTGVKRYRFLYRLTTVTNGRRRGRADRALHRDPATRARRCD